MHENKKHSLSMGSSGSNIFIRPSLYFIISSLSLGFQIFIRKSVFNQFVSSGLSFLPVPGDGGQKDAQQDEHDSSSEHVGMVSVVTVHVQLGKLSFHLCEKKN